MTTASTASEQAARKIAPGTWRRVGGLARPHRGKMILLIGIVIAEAVCGVSLPLLFKHILDAGITPGNREVVLTTALVIGCVGLVQAGLSYLASGVTQHIAEGVILRLRFALFDQLTRLPMAFFSRTQTGALTQRFGSELTGATKLYTTTLRALASGGVGIVLTIGVMIHLSWQVSIIALPLVPVCTVLSRRVGQRATLLTRAAMQSYARKGAYLTDRVSVGGAQLSALYGDPETTREVYNAKASEVRELSLAASLASRPLTTTLAVVGVITTALVYGVGGSLAVEGSLEAGTVVAMALLLSRIAQPLTELSQVRVDVMASMVSFERIFELLDMRPLIADPETPARPGARAGGGSGELRLENVRFSYPQGSEVSLASLERLDGGVLEAEVQPEVLRGISLTCPPGTTTAIVGSSGAGKSTLSHLLPRLYDPTEGRVLLDGVDLRELPLLYVREQVGVVSQDCHLLHDTLRANLLLARADATDEELYSVLEEAQIAALVDGLPEGLDTVVGERGFRLSGGEKQRLAIARVLLKNPSVVVLDEATAALDTRTEALIQETFARALQGRTCVVIAHRLSTVRDADQIVVMEAGEIIEQGTHEELLERDGQYAKLCHSQSVGSSSG